MPSFRSPFAVLTLLALPCCGASGPAEPPAAAPSSAVTTPATTSTPIAAEDPPAAPAHLPTACADPSAPVCSPPGDFVERLCAKPLQDVALALFAKETPFTRLYLRGKLDELDFDEEVLALRLHAPQKGGMVVGSGNGTYDVLRWDGTCSRGVEAEMFVRVRPARPRSAHVQWHRIGSSLQDALIAASDPVKRAHAKRGKECKGASSGDVSKSCEAADQALVDAIVDHVRTRGAIPEPAKLP
jgi:predicted small lipoprotein YifL